MKVTENFIKSTIKSSILESSKGTRRCLDRKNAASQEETDEDEIEFERHCKLDINYVNAKNIVKNKVGFVCDENCATDPVEKRIKKLLDQADIIILKISLGDGDEEVKPYPKLSTTSSKPNPLSLTKSPTPVLEVKDPVPFSSDNDSPIKILQNVELCCEDFQDWLVRGTYSEGDSCSWDDQDEVVKKNKEDVKLRREDMMWRERVLDKFLGKESQMVRMYSVRDPLGLDEKDSGTGTLENGNVTDDALSVRDAFEDLLENELDVSQQSIVTHIRTPTHAFCIDEGEGKACVWMRI